MDLWLNGPKMAWILDLTWVKYIQVEWAPFLSINASLTVKSLKIMPKMAQTMAIFRHKWLIKWPKKIILINIQLLMSSGQFLIPIKYLEVPLSPAWFIVWPALWNRPAPLQLALVSKLTTTLFGCSNYCATWAGGGQTLTRVSNLEKSREILTSLAPSRSKKLNFHSLSLLDFQDFEEKILFLFSIYENLKHKSRSLLDLDLEFSSGSVCLWN